MPPKKHIIIIGVLCVISLGLGYWVGLPEEEGLGGGGGNGDPKEPEFLKQGLVAYYPFNGNAKDESGNGNDGEVIGATFEGDRHGMNQRACFFDGDYDFIDIKHSDTVSFHWSDFTISIWLRYPRQHEDKGGAAFQKNILNNPYPGVNIFAGTAVRFRIIGYPNGLISNKTGLDNNTWNHFIFVKKEDKKTIYINGRLAAEQNSPLENAQRNIENIRLGANLHNMSKQNFIGAMDDVRIYNRALSEAEVKALYEFEKPKTQQASTAKPPAVVTNVVPPDPKPEPPLEEKKIVAPPTFTSNPSNPQNVIVEAAIRKALGKYTGQLTKSDLEKVRRLNLNGTKISDAGLKEVAKLARLEELELAGSTVQISDAGLAELAKLPKLTHLSLWTTQITDAGLEEVAKLKKLTYLHLGRCTLITDKGLKEMAKLKNLEVLYLSNTKITDAGLKEITKSTQFKSLSLEGTRITDAGLRDVAKLQQLIHLNLRSTQITDAGLKDVVKLKQLKELYLWRTQITDAGLKEVAKLHQLSTLNLNFTKVTKVGVAQLQKALPECKIDHITKK